MAHSLVRCFVDCVERVDVADEENKCSSYRCSRSCASSLDACPCFQTDPHRSLRLRYLEKRV